MTIAALAAHMNVSQSDVRAFVSCLKIYTDKGQTIEQAIASHMNQMERLANNAAHPALRQIAVDAFFA